MQYRLFIQKPRLTVEEVKTICSGLDPYPVRNIDGDPISSRGSRLGIFGCKPTPFRQDDVRECLVIDIETHTCGQPYIISPEGPLRYAQDYRSINPLSTLVEFEYRHIVVVQFDDLLKDKSRLGAFVRGLKGAGRGKLLKAKYPFESGDGNVESEMIVLQNDFTLPERLARTTELLTARLRELYGDKFALSEEFEFLRI